ncbi:MAG: hypothetical protein QM803_08875 [Rhodocyclaceae bacterium]
MNTRILGGFLIAMGVLAACSKSAIDVEREKVVRAFEIYKSRTGSLEFDRMAESGLLNQLGNRADAANKADTQLEWNKVIRHGGGGAPEQLRLAKKQMDDPGYEARLREERARNSSGLDALDRKYQEQHELVRKEEADAIPYARELVAARNAYAKVFKQITESESRIPHESWGFAQTVKEIDEIAFRNRSSFPQEPGFEVEYYRSM